MTDQDIPEPNSLNSDSPELAHSNQSTPGSAENAQQPYGPSSTQPSNAQQMYQSAQQQSKSFFARLFDFSFSTFVTIDLARVIYIIAIVVSALSWLFLISSAFMMHPALGFVALIFGWILPLLQIMLLRVLIEAAVALIRVAQNSTEMKEHLFQQR